MINEMEQELRKASTSTITKGMNKWKNMSEEEKGKWVKKGEKEGRNPYNLFLKDWLKKHEDD